MSLYQMKLRTSSWLGFLHLHNQRLDHLDPTKNIPNPTPAPAHCAHTQALGKAPQSPVMMARLQSPDSQAGFGSVH